VKMATVPSRPRRPKGAPPVPSVPTRPSGPVRLTLLKCTEGCIEAIDKTHRARKSTVPHQYRARRDPSDRPPVAIFTWDSLEP